MSMSLPQNADTNVPLLVTSSPLDGTVLCAGNIVFNNVLSNATLSTPVQKHGRHLSGVAECLHAEVRILRHENTELKQILNKHKERMSGKRLILKGKVIASTEEVQQKLAEAERVTEVKKRSKGKKKHVRITVDPEIDDEGMQDCSDDEKVAIGDYIQVQL